MERSMKNAKSMMRPAAIALAICSASITAPASAADSVDAAVKASAATGAALKNRTIGYALTSEYWAIHAKDPKTECPQGFNEGPREQYEREFPKAGPKRTVLETELKREADIWFPSLEADGFPYFLQVGTTAPGINLDGRIGPNDYTSPDGEKGIDNEFNRVQGCISGMRPTPGSESFTYYYAQRGLRQNNYMRILIELTNVDDLSNDGDVTVTIYRGRDHLRTDATTTAYLPYGTQRVDSRWGKRFTHVLRGKIENGVLTTEPADVILPEVFFNASRTEVLLKGSHFKLKLTPEGADGLLGGYVDILHWHRNVQRGYGLYLLGHDPQVPASVYRAMMRHADGYPDQTGRNTAISAAKQFTFKQVFIQHSTVPAADVASRD